MSSLFIGLGGVGTSTLECLSKKMNEYNDSLAARGKKPVKAYYYYIDTFDLLKKDRFDGDKEFRTIGEKSPDSIISGYRDGRQDPHDIQYINKWYDAPSKKTNLIDGADAIRQYSRLALKEDWDSIREELRRRIEKVADDSRGRIYVVTGSCGGTGCGIYMDLLYMISELYSDKTSETLQFDVRLVMAMPKGYISDKNPREDKLTHKAMLNAFGTLSELNAVCKDTYAVDEQGNHFSAFSLCNVNEEKFKKNWSFAPFKYAYLYESAGQTREVVSQKISDFLFEIDLANGSAAFDEILTNVASQWETTSREPFTKAFCAIGQFTIEKSDDIMRKYLKERLLYEVFHKGLIDSEIYRTDTSLVQIEGNKLQMQIEEKIGLICDEIGRSVTNEALKNETLGDTVYRIFTSSPDVRNELTKVVLEQKAILLDQVKRLTYAQCREWLKMYDFTTVFRIIDHLDVNLYIEANKSHKEIGDMIDAAKASSKGGILGQWKPEKAVKQFKDMLAYWMAYEVNRALTASEKDIAIDNKGYLDHCKDFISTAKFLFVMPKENEEWESEFKKRVSDFRQNEDRCYLPDLGDLMDENNNIRPDGDMVQRYEEDLVVASNKADLNEGTCTISLLQEEIFRQMSTNKYLVQSGIILDKLFDPAPSSSNSLRNRDTVARFIQEYIKTAIIIIDELIKTNKKIQEFFKKDIVKRLADLDDKRKRQVCDLFKKYDKVELRTVDMPNSDLTTVNVYISNFEGNEDIQNKLDAVPKDRSVVVDEKFCSDRILKLIVKSGYSIDKYRYYRDYEEYAKFVIKEGEPHDPFIDKRFKGALRRGSYEMNVFKVMRNLATAAREENERKEKEERIQDDSNTNRLDGCAEGEIYVSAAATLYQYFKYLNDHGKIQSEFKNGITLSGTELSFKKIKYNRVVKRYVEEPGFDTIDLSKSYGVNDFISLDSWIDIVMAQKDMIPDENKLITDAFCFLLDNGIHIGDELSNQVADMQGDDCKPLYDYLRAYQDWHKKYKP